MPYIGRYGPFSSPGFIQRFVDTKRLKNNSMTHPITEKIMNMKAAIKKYVCSCSLVSSSLIFSKTSIARILYLAGIFFLEKKAVLHLVCYYR